MAENENNPPVPPPAAPAAPKPSESAKVQPKKETVRISLPPKPTAAPTIKIPKPAAPSAAVKPRPASAPAAPRAAAAPRASAAGAGVTQLDMILATVAMVAVVAGLVRVAMLAFGGEPVM